MNNIKNLFNNITNMIELKNLFILYLIIAANFLAQTFGCKTQYLLNNNMYAKHLIGFFTLFFFVILMSQNNTEDENLYFKKIGVTLILYILFILSTKTKGVYFNIFITLIGINYLINTYIDSLDKDKFKERIEKLKKYSKLIGRLSIIVLVIGVILYYNEKKIEYIGEFKINKFLFGNVDCRNN